MVICKSLNTIPNLDKSVLTIGSFDGMHRGHQEVIKDVKFRADGKNIPSVAITFDPHPKSILHSNVQENWNILTSADKKLELLEKNGIDYVLLIPFDMEFAKITAQDFMDNFIIKYFNPEQIVIGYDHHFGYKREGDAEFLKKQNDKYNFNLNVIEPLKIDGLTVSSTKIREYIQNCDIEAANNYLGWEYELSGVVVKGEGIGSKIGFPTANIKPEFQTQLIPGQGAYCVDVVVNNKIYPGMCNIGNRPTFHDDGNNVIEVNLISEDKLSLLDENITINFKIYIRQEKKYENKIDLVRQLKLDRQFCLSY
ncbi:MAG: bifunctional riboflavin kinase/FAD synthetase [Candidatus Marinimicrobia bacterium]|nr:bifunctional riboflavin kinase/FAD synthetase [Candidatus Neomarinimicrobiota bacterium]